MLFILLFNVVLLAGNYVNPYFCRVNIFTGMTIKELLINGQADTILMVTPEMLKEFALAIMEDAKQMQSEDDTLYTPREFAARHHVNVSTLWRWCKMGVLKRTLIGGSTFYKESDLKIMEG